MLESQENVNLVGGSQTPRLDWSHTESRQYILINDFLFCAWRVYLQNVLRAGSD